MVKQKKPFIIEIKTTRRMKARPAESAKSIWGELAIDLRQTLAMERDAQAGSSAHEECVEQQDLGSLVVADHDGAPAPSAGSRFLEKWIAKKAERPKAGSQDVVAAFLARIEQQKALLAEFQSDPAGFKRWRSAWFRKVAGGFGVSVGHDKIDAGGGLRYVVVDTADGVFRFLDDLGRHAQTDADFQRALEANREQRAARLTSGKAM